MNEPIDPRRKFSLVEMADFMERLSTAAAGTGPRGQRWTRLKADDEAILFAVGQTLRLMRLHRMDEELVRKIQRKGRR